MGFEKMLLWEALATAFMIALEEHLRTLNYIIENAILNYHWFDTKRCLDIGPKELFLDVL